MHKERICNIAGSVADFALSYKNCGLFKVDNGIMCREWAPNVKEAHLIGEFSMFTPWFIINIQIIGTDLLHLCKKMNGVGGVVLFPTSHIYLK